MSFGSPAHIGTGQ